MFAFATLGWNAFALNVSSNVVVDDAERCAVVVRLAKDVEDAGAFGAADSRIGEDHAFAGPTDEVAAGVTACPFRSDTVGWQVASHDFGNLRHKHHQKLWGHVSEGERRKDPGYLNVSPNSL